MFLPKSVRMDRLRAKWGPGSCLARARPDIHTVYPLSPNGGARTQPRDACRRSRGTAPPAIRRTGDGRLTVPTPQVYAEVVGALSALTALLYSVPFILRFAAVPAWSFVLFILWTALFGLFGSMYINEDPEGNGDIKRMKNAVWVDLANMLLWFIHTVGAAAYWWFHRERHSRFTGRAKV